jgi:hypothetical protein
MFALASGTVRTTVIILTSIVVVPLLASSGVTFLAHFYPWMSDIHVGESIYSALVAAPGPLRIFLGNWMLIDV